MRDDRFYLEYIQERIALVERYARDGRETFFGDLRTQDAVLRRMETLAGAAAHLSADLKGRHAHIPWREMVAFRNVLAHAYGEVRLDRVWSAIVGDLPPLKAAATAELERLSLE